MVTKSAGETKKFGQEFGSKLKGGEVLALVGDLGAGKTTFVQGLARGLGIESRIVSPTFILMRKYGHFYHIDLYRLEGDVWPEVQNLGVEEVWTNPENVAVIEWAEKVEEHLPPNTIWVKFKDLGGDKREIEILDNTYR